MVKDRVLTAPESSLHKPAGRRPNRGGACGRSFFPEVSDEWPDAQVARTSYIIATGGAGSSGLPAFESGSLTSKVPSKRMMIDPAI